MTNSRVVAVVPAAGNGSRMKSEYPKQYTKIGQKTLLEHTLDKLLSFSLIDHVVVVINPNDDFFTSLDIAKHPKIKITYGGETRALSVLSGLQQLDDNDWALVHDAARPCIAHQDIENLIKTVIGTQQGGILAVPVSDTIKQANQQTLTIDKSIDRKYLWAAVTPQLFKAQQLKTCLAKALNEHANITDEASAIEYCGGHPLLVQGRRDNIKVTYPEDFAIATFYLTTSQKI